MPEKTCPLSSQQVVDLYFMEHRAKLLDIAAFLDRLERADGEAGLADVRVRALNRAIPLLTDQASDGQADRVQKILELLSDHTTEPTPAAHTQSALGADPGTDY
ncbi:MAG: hypothetical protein EBU59_08860 [Planctomycetia bacterium]|jgi:hypothetical protein|nr:hypothetical protein [Planctomycetia bacterium]